MKEKLFAAAQKGDIAQVELCLEAGISVDQLDENGNTALMYAAVRNHHDLMAFLIKKGANVNARDIKGNTALLDVATWGNFETVRILLENGADPNVSDESGETPLIKATEEHCYEVIGRLIEFGADPNMKDQHGDDAIRIAKYLGHPEIADFLADHGAVDNGQRTHREQKDIDMRDAISRIEYRYNDDRMYVIDVSYNSSPDTASRKGPWVVVTRRNTPDYPPVRVDDFAKREEAVEYAKQVAPATPRVSLDGEQPDPIPTYPEFQMWLESIGLQRLTY